MLTAEEILRLYADRRSSYGDLHAVMEKFRLLYKGELKVDIPEFGLTQNPLTGDIISQGLDQLALRAVSVFPDIMCPPLKRGFARSEEYASIRRRAYLSWWQENGYDLKQHQTSRWLIGYGYSGTIVTPDVDNGIPKWSIRDPLGTYPAPTGDPSELSPADCIFAFQVPWSWLKVRHPEAAQRLLKPRQLGRNAMVDMIEYIDAEQHTLLAVSKASVGGQKAPWLGGPVPQGYEGRIAAEVIVSAPNLAETCWAVVPSRITLDQAPTGQMAKAMNLFQEQARLMALAVVATIKGIFQDPYIEALDGNIAPKVNENNEWYDGKSGKVNIVKGGRVGSLQTNPGFMTNPMIDRIESYIRESTSLPSELSGEAPSSVRTGRRAAHLLGSTIDFPILEYQKILSRAAEAELKIGSKISRAYFGNRQKSFYVSYGKEKSAVDYVPNKHFETDAVQVRYSSPGSDVNSLTVAVGQMVGTGLLSKKTGRKMHPMVEDPEFEEDETIVEGVDAAILQGLQARASALEIPIEDLAFIRRAIRENRMELDEALEEAQKRAQERQAAQTQAIPGSPESQPGISLPQEANPAIPDVEPSIDNLDNIFRNLAAPVRGARGL